jgi:4,5-DOPA dioxygenase extradiol
MTYTQPVLFIGHGSPMNAIEDNAYRRSWQTLGQRFGEGRDWPRPKAILCISAHWLSAGTYYTSAAQPKTIHDFGGFPPALFAQQYPAPGSATLAAQLDKLGYRGDQGQWGFDHGSWSVLKPMFPEATIPLLQLSIDQRLNGAAMIALGANLQSFRDEGVLIVGSGNIVHNLRYMHPTQSYPWAADFDKHIETCLSSRDHASLAAFETHPLTRQAHPSTEHFLPLLYTVGASRATDKLSFFNAEIAMASLSMRSVIWSS